ncbi:MAG TPA: hydrogenase 3 maturation endopeptidase HyCI [Candidatus Edwardsbacteria bacterium]|nr:hydrogenase 3 maturation endopeptidase HyCI [Candidatus Edwardsbacteria bacterium]
MGDWREQLARALGTARVIAVMGIGNEMMGDDAAGVLLVRDLKKLVPAARQGARIHLFECSTTPENFTGAVARAKPDAVLMVDSAEMRAAVGEVRLLDAAAMQTMMHSTHTMPLSFLAGYIERTASTTVLALGIQAGQIMLDQPVSRPVAASVKQAARDIAAIICGRKPRTAKRVAAKRTRRASRPKHRK